jgi:redox-sensitive bicupin YhaK (pirin superfamily)
MKIKTIQSNQRGGADHGWLKAKHSFSFGQFYDEKMIQFGTLRVLNDDWVAPGMGFGTHPHDNMEIITIPLSGTISHKDSTGGEGSIPAGDVQVMSAGSGVTHSEFNHSKSEPLTLFQIWIFPHTRNVMPRYDQKSFDIQSKRNEFHLLVSPDAREETLMIHQNAFIKRGVFDANTLVEIETELASNGLYIMLVEGSVEIDGTILTKRDAMAISEVSALKMNILNDADILILDIPMQ